MRSEATDKETLCSWIKTVTSSKGEERGKWLGHRNMVDMCDLVKLYYFHPLTNGSNSVKKVLPAILNGSVQIEKLYGQPSYGAKGDIKSLNFENWQWIKVDEEGKIIDPYKQLQPVFAGINTDQLDLMLGSDELAEGGSAMVAYAKMQFTEMADTERKAVTSALLRYCELDTLAMVMLYQHWLEVTQEQQTGHAA